MTSALMTSPRVTVLTNRLQTSFYCRTVGVRRPEVGKLGEQIAVRTYPIPRHFPIRDYSQESIGGIVGGFAAVAGVRGRARRVIAEEIREHCPGQPGRFLGRKSAGMLQR